MNRFRNSWHGALALLLITFCSSALAFAQTFSHVRAGQSLTLLSDGRVLLAGGFAGGSKVSSQVFLADGFGHVAEVPGGLKIARAGHSATVLPDGTVLVFGGIDSAGALIPQAERFDPATQSFILQDNLLVPRAFHTATLLMDGRLLIVGGIESGGAFPDDVQFWDYQTGRAKSLHASLLTPRENHSAALLPDGRVLLSGGTDRYGKHVSQSEVFDPGIERFAYVNSDAENSADTASIPGLAASFPMDGSQEVPLNCLIALRFTKLLDVLSVGSSTITLKGPTEARITGKIVAAERGRLVFFTPDTALQPGVTYQIALDGLKDVTESVLAPATISFTTEGIPEEDPGDEWIPNSTNLAGNWRSGTGPSEWQKLPPLKARPGITALAGQVLRLSGYPLMNVTLEVDGKKAQSDHTGRFLISGIAPGHHVLTIDGRSASHRDVVYGLFEAGVDIAAARTNVLNYTIWMTKLDMVDAVAVPSPTSAADTIIRTPRIPGLELHLPANTVIVDHEGHPARIISITPIPVDKPPFPLPPGIQVPTYFTVQPGGAYVDVRSSGTNKGARLFYPNAHSDRPGTVFDFWNYDADKNGWYIYGQGRVSANGSNIVPNPGVLVYEFTGAMVSQPANAPSTGPGNNRCCEPIDLASGLFIYEKTDLTIDDVIPVALTRTYRQGDTHLRAFGIGTNHPYDIFMVGNNNTNPGGGYTYQDLILPDGSRVHFSRTSPCTGVGGYCDYVDAVYQNTSAQNDFYGATLKWGTDGGPGAWKLTKRDGTSYYFPDSDGSAVSQAAAPLQMTDRHGNSLVFTRDSSHNLTKLTTPNARWIQFTYDPSNRITQVQDNIGRTVFYSYDTNGRLTQVTDANGGITNYTYDSYSEMLTITDARGIVYLTNQYDASGRVVLQTQADNSTFQLAYATDPATGIITQTTVTDPRGYITQTNFNSNGYTISEITALGMPEQQSVTYTRDPNTNLIINVTDSLNRQTSYTYDALGNVTSTTKLAGTANAVTTIFAYEPTFSQLASTTDPLNLTTTFNHDSSGNLTTITDPLNHTITMSYLANGLLANTTDAMNNTSQLAHFAGVLSSVTDPLGNVSTQFTDAIGRVISKTNALGQRSLISYNALDLVVTTTDPNGGVTAFTYDGNGNLLTVTDALNHTITYTYNNMDRLSTRTDSLNRSESYTYDLNGNVSSFTNRKGQVTTFSYDGLNRKIFVGFGAVTSGGTTTYQSTVGYTYDAGDRLTQVVDSLSGTIIRGYDLLDRITSETTPLGSISYTYDVANRRATMTVAGQPQILYSYDNANRLIQLSQGSSIVSFSYDNANRRSSMTLANGIVVLYAYDNDSRLTGLSYRLGGSTIGDLTYAYDSVGRRIQVGGSFARTGLPSAISFATYDAANELVQWGTSALLYDANGNLISDGASTYNWDARNQLSSISGAVVATFQYDGFGRRTQRNNTGFFYDGVNSVQEISGGSPTANILSAETDDNFSRSDISGTWSFLSDGLGSTLGLSDATGTIQTQYTYEPFGNTSAAGLNTSNPAQYTGRENDGTGLYYYRARYYNPVLQRFISEDPFQLNGGDVDFYIYSENSPIVYRDPSGLRVTCIYSVSAHHLICIQVDTGVQVVNETARVYSGKGPGLNNTAYDDVTDVGPIPQGMWDIGTAKPGIKPTPVTLPLNPQPGTNVHNRPGFEMHGDMKSGPPNMASRGCIVVPKKDRDTINNQGGGNLAVVP